MYVHTIRMFDGSTHMHERYILKRGIIRINDLGTSGTLEGLTYNEKSTLETSNVEAKMYNVNLIQRQIISTLHNIN